MKNRINIDHITKTFLEYTLINTTSDPTSKQLPSSPNQHKLAEFVANQFSSFKNVDIDIQSNAITTITLPSNMENAPAIVFFAHLDTAPDQTGDTKAIVLENYDGLDIKLPASGESICTTEYPELKDYIGQNIIITDGTSLLGADDKAAIAAGVEALRYMIENPDFKHGTIRLVLLPDEEIGLGGAKALNVKELNSDFGICLDCCAIGEYVVENWYAGSSRIKVQGKTAHPMNAKGNMVNALTIAAQVIEMLPSKERPEYTEGREGYFWPNKLNGDTACATLDISIRDFEKESYQNRKQKLETIVKELQKQWGQERISITIEDVYDNVKPSLDKNPAIMQYVQKAMENLEITPKPLIMRGGYDGSAISPKGLPTVNIFTGAHNFHSTKEYLPTHSLRMAGEMLLEIVELSTKGRK